MMTPSSIAHMLVAVCFSLTACLFILASLLGIPGGWILIALAVIVDLAQGLWLPSGSPFVFHPITIIACAFVGVAGEFVESALGGLGAKRFGASKYGIVGAIAGSPFGALAGTIFLPVPPLGTLLGAGVGAALGALVGELLARKRAHESLKPALGAAVGRVLGSLAKLPFIVTIGVILAVAVFVP